MVVKSRMSGTVLSRGLFNLLSHRLFNLGGGNWKFLGGGRWEEFLFFKSRRRKFLGGGRWEEFLFSNRGSEVRRDELTGGTAAAAGGSGAAGETKTSTEAAVFVRRSTDNTGWE